MWVRLDPICKKTAISTEFLEGPSRRDDAVVPHTIFPGAFSCIEAASGHFGSTDGLGRAGDVCRVGNKVIRVITVRTFGRFHPLSRQPHPASILQAGQSEAGPPGGDSHEHLFFDVCHQADVPSTSNLVQGAHTTNA